MSFENGSVSMRMFWLAHTLPVDWRERLTARQMPAAQSIGTEPVMGWAGGRHVLDVPVTEENTSFGGVPRFQLVKAERKVAKTRLQAECAIEEQADMQHTGKSFVDRKTRAEIRKNVMARMLVQQPPTFKAIPCVVNERDRILFAGAASESQCDALRMHWRNAFGFDPVPVTAETLAAQLGMSARDWGKTSFSPEVPDAAMEETPGLDFLTWVWFQAEARGGLFESKVHGRVGLMLDGPIQFARVGGGAHLMALKNGFPMISTEAQAALLGGKKLYRARLIMALPGDQVWSCGFDADAFVFRGLKLPESKDMLDAASAFADRVQKMDLFRELLLDLFDQFASEISDCGQWKATKTEIWRWVKERKGKR